MRFKPFIGVVVLLSSLVFDASANNLQITNVSLEDRDAVKNTMIVEFDITWDNSWRNSTNYDAVWIVVKVRNSSHWYPAPMQNFGLNPTDTSPGSNSGLDIYVPKDNTDTGYFHGAFIYRRASGTGTVISKDVRLKVNYSTFTGMTDTTTTQAKVVGVEMVYIPEGPFYAGDTTSTAGFQQGSSDTDPWYIDSDSTIQVNNAGTNSFYYTSDGNTEEFSTGQVFTIPQYFPTGYDAFYCMKYEVSEGLWMDHYNSLLDGWKTPFDITSATGKNSDSVVKRNTISWVSGDASGSRPDRAMNWISWPDLAALLDWLALRPMTELEYEKVARGELTPVAGEYAWGSTSITAGVTFSGSPEDGNAAFSTANANAVYNITTFSQGDDYLGAQYVQGPARVGIFATSSSTRSSSGAGYYGVMELSGNVWERAVTVGNTHGQYFFPTSGRGYGGLSSLTIFGWPGFGQLGGNDGISTGAGMGFRGGGWRSAATELRVSDRSAAAYMDAARYENASYSSYGGRGVRSAGDAPVWALCGNGSIEPPEQCDDAAAGQGIDYICSECLCTDNLFDGDGICD